MLTLLPIAMAPAALPPTLLPSPPVCSGGSPDAALIAKCQEFIRADQAAMEHYRMMASLADEHDWTEHPAEMEAEMRRLNSLIPDQDEIGEIPAATVAGLRAKAEAKLHFLARHDDGRFEKEERLIGGILLDLLRLT
ncbi:hypothetical protein EAH89_26180 [Roseomonas nepalensis]|uniref:Uncharacterized protein n=1 Tax=Muricoccus nepalensis TaxID=1854500 RepID=A0A502F8Q9_9PROT|nr:hypothetical protein [Roseomonas nepalensis]TPG45693.1 hypothetical protein EAH89_26180 [Roseomonas nepalensis]